MLVAQKLVVAVAEQVLDVAVVANVAVLVVVEQVLAVVVDVIVVEVVVAEQMVDVHADVAFQLGVGMKRLHFQLIGESHAYPFDVSEIERTLIVFDFHFHYDRML